MCRRPRHSNIIACELGGVNGVFPTGTPSMTSFSRGLRTWALLQNFWNLCQLKSIFIMIWTGKELWTCGKDQSKCSNCAQFDVSDVTVIWARISDWKWTMPINNGRPALSSSVSATWPVLCFWGFYSPGSFTLWSSGCATELTYSNYTTFPGLFWQENCPQVMTLKSVRN
jgi:hypothetical protein